MKELPNILKLKDIASYLHVTKHTVRNWILAGDLPAYKFGIRGDYRIRKDALEGFLTNHNEQFPAQERMIKSK